MSSEGKRDGRGKPKVVAYTDGACSGNPGPGGWGAILKLGDHEKELSGCEPATTNQRMELTAAIGALEELRYPCSVKLHSDSAYMVNAFNQKWVKNWQRNGWVNARKAPVANRDLFERLIDLCLKHDVEWVKVKGHSDDEMNNRCDRLAQDAVGRCEER